jgi:Ca-activated chloride channel homolog
MIRLLCRFWFRVFCCAVAFTGGIGSPQNLPPALIASGLGTPAQAAGTVSPHPDKQGTETENLVVNVELVNVLFTLTDRKGKLVTDLDRSDFRLLEDNRPQTITNFSRETDLPLTVALLIDTSTSIRDKFKFEQEAATDFLVRTLRAGKDKALLITFDSAIELVQDFTDDTDLLRKAIHQIRPGGGTKLLDSIFLACQEKMKTETGRKIMIVISDGDDNLSLETLNSTMEMAQKSDASIYTISTNSSGFFGITAPKADKLLKRLAEETGGRAFFPFKAEDLSQSFQDIGIELRSQYSLAYRSSNVRRDGSFRAIRIETDRKNLKVKARKGYYAPKG